MKYSKFNSYTINLTQSLPSLRGDVNEVDRGELKVIIRYKFKKKNLSTPPPLRGTSPQSREGLKIKYY